jgi:hypothetical protein
MSKAVERPQAPEHPLGGEHLQAEDAPPTSMTRAEAPPMSGSEHALAGAGDPHSEEPMRSQALPGRMLDREPDPELQCIVEAAASGTGFPMAAVSLGVRHSVVFRAHVGLPPELDAARSIERASSFCKLVIERAEPVFLGDAKGHEGTPQELVERFGMRAYVGVPLRMQGRVLGALCVLDTKPRADPDDFIEKLERLAQLAGRRLAELSGKAPTPGNLISHAAEPAFAEIRNLLSSVVANAAYGRMVAGDLEPLVDLLSQAIEGRLPPTELERAESALPHAIEAQRELAFAFAELESVAKKLIDTVGGLEKTVASRTSYEHTVGEAVEAATLAAHHFTKLVGGVRWAPFPPSLDRKLSPSWMGLVVSIGLQELAGRLGSTAQEGIDAQVIDHGTSLSVVLGAPRLSEAECKEIAGELSFLLSSVASLEVSAEGSSIRLRL